MISWFSSFYVKRKRSTSSPLIEITAYSLLASFCVFCTAKMTADNTETIISRETIIMVKGFTLFRYFLIGIALHFSYLHTFSSSLQMFSSLQVLFFRDVSSSEFFLKKFQWGLFSTSIICPVGEELYVKVQYYDNQYNSK